MEMNCSAAVRKGGAWVILMVLMVPISQASSQGKWYVFRGAPDGAYPTSALTEDASGNFYGVSTYGGIVNSASGCPLGCGTIYMFSKSSSGSWQKSIIYRFPANVGGRFPSGTLILDSSGNIFGTAAQSASGYGIVFELSPSNGGWNLDTLYTFQGSSDGGSPLSGVIFDGEGNLYGTASYGGICSVNICGGVVFKLAQNQGGPWTESVLYAFQPQPFASLVPSALAFDSSGNLYGTTQNGGANGFGSVFELTPNEGGTWTESDLYSFENSSDGGYPSSGVVFDAAGNMYGETSYGGSFTCSKVGCGVIFELTPQAGATWSEKTAYTFDSLNGRTGDSPAGGLVLDAAGNLYGTTVVGGVATCHNLPDSCGTIFELSPSMSFRLLGSFNGTDGAYPYAGPIIDRKGNIYGTASQGGDFTCGVSNGCGTVFEFTPY
jgi:uncharacterized repeat protein (TIGR03803 family)